MGDNAGAGKSRLIPVVNQELNNNGVVVDFDILRAYHPNFESVSLYIMAVPELESYGSTFTRYVDDLSKNNNPRWVEKVAHDESYEGVLKTVEEFEKQKICSTTKVFTRGPVMPKEIYSNTNRQFPTTVEAIQYGRTSGRRQATSDFWNKYKKVYVILRNTKPELLKNLVDWEEMFKREYTDILTQKSELTRSL